MKRRGRFIVLEGLDGAGTTTQCAALAKSLRGAGHDVQITHEPSVGPIGTLLRQALNGRLGLPSGVGPLTPQTLALLFAADRVDHLAAEVTPALARGSIVLCDRYVLSSLAYQGSQLGMEWVETINSQARLPDVTLFLKVDVSVAAKRRQERGSAEELYETVQAQRRISKQYHQAIVLRTKAGERIVELDGDQPVEVVTARALAVIERLISVKRSA